MRDRTPRAAGRSGASLRLSLLACVWLGCLHPQAGAECSGEVASLDGIEPRRLHTRVLLSRDAGTERHEMVVRAAPGRIEAIGLTPMGTQAYRLVHDREGIEVENRVGRHLGLSPRLAYDAVAHAYLAQPDPSQAIPVRTMQIPRCGYEARVVLVSDEPITPAPAAPPPA